MKKLFHLGILLGFLLGCQPSPTPQTTSETPVETMREETLTETSIETVVDTPTKPPEDTGPIETPIVSSHLMTLYYQSKSKAYQQLEGPIVKMLQNLDHPSIRLVVNQENVNINYQKIEYLSWLDVFRVVEDEVFLLNPADPKTIYEFKSDVGNTIPQYQIVASKEDLRTVWMMVDSGLEAYDVVEVEVTEPYLVAPYEGGPYDTLVSSIAYQAMVDLDDQPIRITKENTWFMISSALSAFSSQQEIIEPSNDHYGYMTTETWIIDGLAQFFIPNHYQEIYNHLPEDLVLEVEDNPKKYDISYLDYSISYLINSINYETAEDGSIVATVSINNTYTDTDHQVKVYLDLSHPLKHPLLPYQVVDVQLIN